MGNLLPNIRSYNTVAGVGDGCKFLYKAVEYSSCSKGIGEIDVGKDPMAICSVADQVGS